MYNFNVRGIDYPRPITISSSNSDEPRLK